MFAASLIPHLIFCILYLQAAARRPRLFRFAGLLCGALTKPYHPFRLPSQGRQANRHLLALECKAVPLTSQEGSTC